MFPIVAVEATMVSYSGGGVGWGEGWGWGGERERGGSQCGPLSA